MLMETKGKRYDDHNVYHDELDNHQTTVISTVTDVHGLANTLCAPILAPILTTVQTQQAQYVYSWSCYADQWCLTFRVPRKAS